MPIRSFRATALRFLVVHLLVTAIVAAAAVGWSSVAARARALDATAQAAREEATALVAPLCTAGLDRGDADAVRALDGVVRGRLRDGSVLRVKVWTGQGRILYSDATSLIGRSYPLQRAERRLLGTSGAVAEVSDLDRDENLLESAAGHLVEAYAAMAGADGHPLLFEAYYVVDHVDGVARHDSWAIIPLALVTIFGLYLVQAPLVLRLARGVDTPHRRRRGRLRLAVSRWDLERARVARELRDGVVQDLAGVAYLLESTGADAVRPATTVLRDDLRRLRRTVADLSVADLSAAGPGAADPARAGLRAALAALLQPLAAAGVRCELSVAGAGAEPGALSPESARLLHRAARELVRTAPGAVSVDLSGNVLTVTGVGPAEQVNLLALAVRDAGGSYQRNREPNGETVRVAVK